MSQLILIGGGEEIMDLCLEADLEVVARLSTDDPEVDDTLNEYPKLPLLLAEDNPALRQNLVEKFQKQGRSFIGVVHPSAQVSGDVEIGVGAIVQYGCFVARGARIGAFSHLSVGVTLMGDSVVESYCTLDPKVVVMQSGKVRAKAHLPAGTVVERNFDRA